MKPELCLAFILWVALVSGQEEAATPVAATETAAPAAAGAGSPAASTRGFFGPGGGFGGGGGFDNGFDDGFGNGGGFGGSFGGGFGGFPGGGRPGRPGRPGQGGFNGGFNGGSGGGFNGGFLNQAPPATCRFWCRTPQGQAFCCESADQAPTPVFTKNGLCPPIRDTCPLRSFGAPSPCSNDGACSGVDKCCFDTCLQINVCKPPQGFGRR